MASHSLAAASCTANYTAQGLWGSNDRTVTFCHSRTLSLGICRSSQSNITYDKRARRMSGSRLPLLRLHLPQNPSNQLLLASNSSLHNRLSFAALHKLLDPAPQQQLYHGLQPVIGSPPQNTTLLRIPQSDPYTALQQQLQRGRTPRVPNAELIRQIQRRAALLVKIRRARATIHQQCRNG